MKPNRGRKIIAQGGVMSEEDNLDTLLTSLPKKYDILRVSYYAQPVVRVINNLWDRMLDIESTKKRRTIQSGAAGVSAEVYYQGRGRRGRSFRGRS